MSLFFLRTNSFNKGLIVNLRSMIFDINPNFLVPSYGIESQMMRMTDIKLQVGGGGYGEKRFTMGALPKDEFLGAGSQISAQKGP